MKNNVKRSSVALAILMAGTMLTPVQAHLDDSMDSSNSYSPTQHHKLFPETHSVGSVKSVELPKVHMLPETVTLNPKVTSVDSRIPDYLTKSQMPKAGINYWTESVIFDAAGAAQTKIVNRNDLIKNSCGYAQEAYDNYLSNKAGTYENKMDVTPFYFGGQMEGLVSYKAGIDGQKGKIVVAFRGTKEGWDWGTNLDGLIGDIGYIYGTTGTVHHGFHTRYMQVRESITAAIKMYQAKYGLDTDIDVTGHSLGGASASLAAADIKQNILSTGKLKLTSFNAPRVFDTKGAEDVSNLIGENNMLRVWRENDPVSMAALGILGYKHVGTAVKLAAKDTACVMNWSGKVVPNHLHKENVADVNGNDIVFAEEHIGKMTQLGNMYEDAKNSTVAQSVRNLWNAATDNVVGNAIASAKDYVASKASDAYNAAKPYGRTAVQGVIDYGIKPVVKGTVAAASAVKSAGKAVGSGVVDAANTAYDAVSNAASKANNSFWNYLGY